MLLILVLSSCYAIANAILYDSYFGYPVTRNELARFEEADITATCTNEVYPCDPNEWRRVDGTCNNLEHPSRGAFQTPQLRLLEPVYNTKGGGFEPRLTTSGEPFELARILRSRLLPVGFAMDDFFTQTTPYYIEYVLGDFGSTHDITNYIFRTTYCCEERGKTDPMCTPNYVPADDHVHRFSGIRCLNLTRPISFQNLGCIKNNTAPDRIDYTTTTTDVSMIYAYKYGIISSIRDKSGLLKTEIVNGREYPSDANETTTCFIKQAIETGCNRDVPNGLLGTNFLTLIYWRYHNLIARELAKLNPCWDDDMLFYTARDINIAVNAQILYYELMPLLFGKVNLLKNGIISRDPGFRDVYNPKLPPRTILESVYMLRYFHTVQDTTQKLYNKDYVFVNTTPVVRFNLRVQDLAVNDTMSLLLHGVSTQPSGKFDHIVDPDIADNGLGILQKAFDIPTADLAKGRFFGFPPYIKYRDLCTGKSHTSFEDLRDVISEERLEVLKEIYGDVNDVELMAGVWSENLMKDGHVPPTAACLLMKHMKYNVLSDRHWYERHNRPHAFTYNQLQQIRKVTLASVFCAVGEDVTRIQRQAFLRIGPGNYLVSCNKIPRIDFTAWKDPLCSRWEDKQHYNYW